MIAYEVEFPKKPFKLPAYACLACLTSKIQFGFGTESRGFIMKYVELFPEDFEKDHLVHKSLKEMWTEVKETDHEIGPTSIPVANVTSTRYISDLHFGKEALFVH
jgi:hypothetical protein